MRQILLACALVASFAACKKSQDKTGAATGSAPGSGSAAATGSGSGATAAAGSGSATPQLASADPWDAPHETTKAELPGDVGDKSGAGLAAITHTELQTSDLQAKVDIGSIEKQQESSVNQIPISGFGAAKPTGFRVVYNPSKEPSHEQYRKIFQENHVFEKVAEGLNSTVRLPTTIDINTVDCGTVNAFYDPNNKRIIVCYELLDYFLNVFKPHMKDQNALGNAVLGAVMFSFYHEGGHGLIDVLDLASVGREEDAVDQLATLILIAAGDDGVAMAMSGAHWFKLQEASGQKTAFWDEHAFDGQRFYNIVCLIYGSDTQKYASWVNDKVLPSDRAKRCPEEYRKINKAWEKLLAPHMTNGAADNVDYKPTVAEKEAPGATNDDPWDSSDDETPEPVTPQPTSGAITCEQVAMRAAELIADAAEEQAKSMTAEQIEELKARLEAELPAAMQTILSECAKANWSQASRKCVIDAKALDEASKCQ